MLTGMLALQNPLSPGAPALPSTAMTTQKVDGHVHVAKVDNELTSLSWLQKPGVLTSMCTALTGSPHRVSKTGSRSARKPRQPRSFENKGELVRKPKSVNGSRDADKMVNVILNVRNRKYDWEDADKPSISFACMIFMAIESSPTKTLPVKEIYDWIMWKFAFYRGAQPGWKNSVRHNLSLNKCFKKVDRGSKKSKSPLSKGGLWTVDPDYRRSLLAALRRSPYHPYHSYLSPPLSPSSSNSNLESLDPAERDAALTMCMIGGSSDETPGLTPDILYSIYHDHCYAKRPPPVTFKLRTAPRKGLSLAEVAAAAELILRQDQEMEEGKESEGFDSSDEGFGGEESECEEGECEEEEEEEEEEMETDTDPRNHSLADSGYSQLDTPPTPLSLDARCSSMEELGADALLCLAGGSKKTTIPSQDMPTEQPS